MLPLPEDFLGTEINVGSWIVYPVGGTSARMVLAKVVELIPSRTAMNGLRRGSWYAKVNRYKEGTLSRNIDSKRKVNFENFHRCVVITRPEWIDE